MTKLEKIERLAEVKKLLLDLEKKSKIEYRREIDELKEEEQKLESQIIDVN